MDGSHRRTTFTVFQYAIRWQLQHGVLHSMLECSSRVPSVCDWCPVDTFLGRFGKRKPLKPTWNRTTNTHCDRHTPICFSIMEAERFIALASELRDELAPLADSVSEQVVPIL